MIFTSPHADVAIPDAAVHRFVLERAAALGGKPALIDGPSGRVLTYGALAAGVDRVAAGLAARGFGKGDVLGIFAPNLPEFALAFYGAMAAGGIVTPVSPLATEDDIAKQLQDAGARFLVTVAPLLERAGPAARRAGIEKIFLMGDEGDERDEEDATSFATLLNHDHPVPDVAIDPASDLAVLPYSSGTTGLGKGVMLTHRNLVANLVQTEGHWNIGDDDRVIAVMPFFHIYGMNVIMNLGLRGGSTLVTMPRFTLDAFLGLIQKHRVTVAFVAPPVVVALAKHPSVDGYDLTSLRTIKCGAAPLAAALQDACIARLGCGVAQGYGMTESSPVTHATSNAPGKSKSGTVGPLVPNTECRVVDVASGADLGPGEDGELWVRGPQVMRGYLNQPAATAATLDAGGWLHTGDIGHADEDGYFSIVDRLKELIKYKGYQVPPAELEAVLLTHPGVADAAVIGLPDDEAGEVPKAFVVLKAVTSPEALLAFVAERVAPHKRIRCIEVIDAIPKSPSGKILRRLLKDCVPAPQPT